MWTHTGLINGKPYLVAQAGAMALVKLNAPNVPDSAVQFVSPKIIENLQPRGMEVH